MRALTLTGAGVLLYLGVVQMGIAYILFNRGLKRVAAAEASLISMLEPVLNPVWVLLGTGWPCRCEGGFGRSWRTSTRWW